MTLRLGIVGAGGIASAYSQIIADCDRVEAVGVADIDPMAAKTMALALDTEPYDSHLALMEMAKPDAVIVCTPPNTHRSVTTDFLEAGVNVMCEKPLAMTTGDARAMLEVAASSSAILTMASKFRYVADVRAAREIAQSGVIGDLILIENTFASRVAMGERWNSQPEIAGGGVLIDNGTHSVDVIRYLMGPIDQVMAVEGRRVQGLDVEDTAQIFLKSKDGVRATVDLSWSVNKQRDWFIEIYGSGGTIQVGWQESRYRIGDDGEWISIGDGYDRDQALRDQVSNFAAAINGGEPLLINASDAIASVEVIEAAYRSMARDGWVPIEASVG